MRLFILLLISCTGLTQPVTNDMYVKTVFKGQSSCEYQRVSISAKKRSVCFFIKEWHCYQVSMRYLTDTGTMIVATDIYGDRMSIRYIQRDDGIAIFISGKHQPNFFITTHKICDL